MNGTGEPGTCGAGERGVEAAGRQLDGSCPYCAGPLFKESWVLRCPRDHRFRATFRRGDAAAGPPSDAFLLRVVAHPDRAEIGRLHAYAVPPRPSVPATTAADHDGAAPGGSGDREPPAGGRPAP